MAQADVSLLFYHIHAYTLNLRLYSYFFHQVKLGIQLPGHRVYASNPAYPVTWEVKQSLYIFFPLLLLLKSVSFRGDLDRVQLCYLPEHENYDTEKVIRDYRVISV